MGSIISRLGSELRARWRAWTAVAFLIGIGGGVVLTTAAGARRTASAYDRFLRTSHAADLLVSPDQTGFPDFYKTLARETHAEVTPVVGYGAAPVDAPEQPLLISSSPDPRWITHVERPKITAGRIFRPSASDEVVADITAAHLLHLHVGSVLHLVVAKRNEEQPNMAHDERVTVRVVGIGVTRDSVAVVNALANAPTLGAGSAFARRFGPNDYAFDGAYVTLRPGTSKASFTATAQALARRLRRETHGNLSIADEAQQAAKVNHAIRPQAVALGLFAALTALTALVAIAQVLSRRLFLASTENDALRALGMTRRQLFAIGTAEVGAVTLAGAVVAVVLAIAASPRMPIGPARLAEPHPGIAFDWTVLIIGLVAIVVLFVAIMAVPAWRLTARTDASGARGRSAARPSTATRWATAAGTPPNVAVGVGYAVDAGRGRSAVPTRGVIVVTALAVAAITATVTFGANLSRLVHTPRLYGQSWDVTVDAQFSPLPKDPIDTLLRHQAGVTSWTFGTHIDVTTAARDIVPGIALVSTTHGPIAPTVVAGRAVNAADEIALGSKTLDSLHRAVGQTVTVRLPNIGPQTPPPQRLRIVGRSVFPFFGEGSFTPTGLGVGAEITESALGTSKQIPLNLVLIRVAPGKNRSAEIRGVTDAFQRAHLCGAYNQCSIATTIRPTDILNYARIQNTPRVLAAVLALLAIGVLANLLVTSIRRRRRDLAILKTLGFRRRQVSAAVAWQATTVMALALVFGLPIGVAVGRRVWSTFASNLGIPGDPRIPIVFLIAIIPIAIVIANLIAAIPGLMASRTPAAEVLRTE